MPGSHRPASAQAQLGLTVPPPLLPPSALRLQDIFALNAAYNRFYELNVALMMRLTLLAAKEASAAQVRSRGVPASPRYPKCPGPANLGRIPPTVRARHVSALPPACRPAEGRAPRRLLRLPSGGLQQLCSGNCCYQWPATMAAPAKDCYDSCLPLPPPVLPNAQCSCMLTSLPIPSASLHSGRRPLLLPAGGS